MPCRTPIISSSIIIARSSRELWLTVIVGIVQIGVAILFMRSGESALGLALSVASLINGPVLGVFLVGTFMKKAREVHALSGMLVSISLMLYILLATKIAWTWYALIGSIVTVVVAFIVSIIIPAKNDEVPV